MAKRRKTFFRLTPERAQIIATAIVRGEQPLKVIAMDFGCSYGTVWTVLQEYVIVQKTLVLRYPEGPPQASTEPVQRLKTEDIGG